jgi:hypothetical protein
VRRTRSYQEQDGAEGQPASARTTMRQLREAGHSADDVAAAVARLDVRPVLTAHPTESTRRTLLGLQARVAELLLDARSLPSTSGARSRTPLEARSKLLGSRRSAAGPPVGARRGRHVPRYLEDAALEASERAQVAPVCAAPFEAEFRAGGRRAATREAGADRQLGRGRPRRQPVRHPRVDRGGGAGRCEPPAIARPVPAGAREAHRSGSRSPRRSPPRRALQRSLAGDEAALPEVVIENPPATPTSSCASSSPT